MNSARWQRIGAALLIAGGLLEAGVFAIGSVISPAATTVLGAGLLQTYSVALAAIGIGLVATGASLAGRGRTALRVAGTVAVIGAGLAEVESVTGAVLGAALAQATYLLYVVSDVVAAVRLRSNTRLPAAARWSLAMPATCFVLTVIAEVMPPLLPPGIAVLPWVGTAVAGALLLLSCRNPSLAAV